MEHDDRTSDRAAPAPGAGARAPEDAPSRLEHLERSLATVQERLDALTAEVRGHPFSDPASSAALASPGAPASPGPLPDSRDADLPAQFWALQQLRREAPRAGAVVYAGTVDVGPGHVEYQWARSTEDLLRADWAERADRVGALGNPLRLAILRLLLDGERTVAQLVDELSLSSTGIAYHHLQPLQAAGWATSPQRGRWAIPPARVVPLLAIITALEDS